MPYDGQNFPQTKPDVFSLEGLAAWLETQDPEREYCYDDTGKCLVGQYLRENTDLIVGVNEDGDAIYREDGFYTRWRFENSIYPIPITLPNTFGAALERTRAAIAERSQ